MKCQFQYIVILLNKLLIVAEIKRKIDAHIHMIIIEQVYFSRDRDYSEAVAPILNFMRSRVQIVRVRVLGWILGVKFVEKDKGY